MKRTTYQRFRLTRADAALMAITGDRIQPETILPGVSFTLYDLTTGGTVGSAETNADGEITFGGESMLLVIGGHSYKLAETKPNGYTAVEPIFFKVTTDGKIFIEQTLPAGVSNPEKVSNPNVSNLVAVNTRKLGTLSIVKKDGVTDEALNNISFELYRVNEFNEDGSPKNFFEIIIDFTFSCDIIL